MKESIQKLDLNFTNGGGGHTASVSSIAGARSLDGSQGLGIVVGELGEINAFSNDKVSDLMSNFICTSHSVGADPTKKVISRKYIDKTSLLLKSYVILVRGKDCGPETLDFEGPFPYFTETKGSPLKAWKPKPPVVDRKNSVIMIGKIYNFEAAAKFNGVKITLVYNNKDLKKDLSLNDETVSSTYINSPDLSKYNLKFGYTVTELKQALNQVGVAVSGLPNNDKVLFENSGSLDSVLGSIASYFGYFWFVNPQTGIVEFINTAQAASIRITDYTNSENQNIINASFTRSTTFNKLVNLYQGSAEKPESGSTNYGNDRVRKVFFKRIYPENMKGFPLGYREVGAFFAIFNQNQSADTFDKFTYILSNMNKDRKDRAKSPAEDVFGRKLNFGDLYTQTPRRHKMWKYHKGDKKLDTIFTNKKKAEENGNRKPLLIKTTLDRFNDEFVYFPLEAAYRELTKEEREAETDKEREERIKLEKDKNTPMAKPSLSALYSFLKTFYKFAGGIFISNGYSKYKAERMQWQNSSNLTISGPFEKDTKISEIESLSDLLEAFMIANPDIKEAPTIGKLAEATNGEATFVNDFHFIAVRSIKQREKINDDDYVDFKVIEHFMEIWPQVPNAGGAYLGGPKVVFQKGQLGQYVFSLVEQSYKNYLSVYEKEKKVIACKYVRSQTRVNKENEEGEEDEDNKISESSANDQAMSDLFDRFDLKSYKVKGPAHNILNNITLSSFSGSTTEMEALKKERVNYDHSISIPQSSSRTIYGLRIPKINATTNSISISVGANGIQTTINESTIKLIPPDQQFLTNRGMDISNKSLIPSSFSATQRNFFGL